jgi:hypothetical protein
MLELTHTHTQTRTHTHTQTRTHTHTHTYKHTNVYRRLFSEIQSPSLSLHRVTTKKDIEALSLLVFPVTITNIFLQL